MNIIFARNHLPLLVIILVFIFLYSETKWGREIEGWGRERERWEGQGWRDREE